MKSFLLLIFCSSFYSLFAQIGATMNSADAVNGYTLFAPGTSDTTYLIDNCGRQVNKWASTYTTGHSAYLMPDGHLWRACKLTPPPFSLGGIGGRIEKYDWSGNLVWSYNYSDSTKCHHHDMQIMPNGNVLLLIIEVKDATDCINAGRDTALIPPNGQLWSEAIVEIEPVGTDSGNVVWEWHAWDHIVQDFDATKPNYGAIANHPELVDLNFYYDNIVRSDWLHANSISYSEDLDQIIISLKFLSEFWIIDHSTSSSEAASHNGGNSGKGGDILYRWGNPVIYGAGTSADQKLFGQHNVQWIPSGRPGAGNISLYNNGLTGIREYSTVDLLTNQADASGNYTLQAGASFGPDSAYWSYTNANLYSPILSGAQILHNGNILICEGKEGHLLEIDSSKNIVWDYILPIGPNGSILSQGQSIISISSVFRALRFTPDYPAFTGKTLTPGALIEDTPLLPNCTIHTSINQIHSTQKELLIYPNPSSQTITIETKDESEAVKLEVFNSLGQRILETKLQNNYYQLDIENWDTGIYWFKINNYTPKTVLVQH